MNLESMTASAMYQAMNAEKQPAIAPVALLTVVILGSFLAVFRICGRIIAAINTKRGE